MIKKTRLLQFLVLGIIIATFFYSITIFGPYFSKLISLRDGLTAFLEIPNKLKSGIQEINTETLVSEKEQEVFYQLPLEKSTTLMFVGDIMLSRAVGRKMRLEENFRWPFEKIKEYLRWADLLFGNLECPITEGRPIRSGEMVFRADPEVVEGLKWTGFDILSLANNHTMNWGELGLKDTFKYLDDAGISYVGAGIDITQALEPKILEVDGLKIAFLAFNDSDVVPISYEATDTRAGTAFMRILQMKEKVGEAKEKADLVVVSMHSGTEYAYQPNNRQINFAKSAIEAGADLVVGHHPHVIQKTEEHEDGWVAYSLGNFVFDQTFSERTRRGQILEVIVEEGKIKEVKTTDVRINDFYQPELISK